MTFLLSDGRHGFFRTFTAKVGAIFMNTRNCPFGKSAHAESQLGASIICHWFKYGEVKDNWPVTMS